MALLPTCMLFVCFLLYINIGSMHNKRGVTCLEIAETKSTLICMSCDIKALAPMQPVRSLILIMLNQAINL